MRVMRIDKNLSQIDENRSTVETCWIGTVGTLHVMIGIGNGAENFTILGTFFIVISLASSDSQKKENS